MNTGTVRILVISALLVSGIGVLASGFTGSSGGAVALPTGQGGPSGTPTPEPSTTKSPQPASTPSPQIAGVNVMVFNGTNVVGLGGQVQKDLEKDDYTFPANADDAPHKPMNASIVYFRGGDSSAQSESDARYLADTYLNGARVKELSPDFESLVDPTVTVVVVVGVDFATA